MDDTTNNSKSYNNGGSRSGKDDDSNLVSISTTDDSEVESFSEPSSRDEEREVRRLLRNENKAVNMWREIVTGALVITATLVTVTTYIFLQREEVNDFHWGFREIAGDIVESSTFKMTTTVEAFQGLADMQTSFAGATGANWPNVTLPDYARHGEHVRRMTGTHHVTSCPIVTNETLAGWEAYAAQTSPYPDEARVHCYDAGLGSMVPVSGPGPFGPVWQMSPVPIDIFTAGYSPVNYDMLSLPEYASLAALAGTLSELALSKVLNITHRNIMGYKKQQQHATQQQFEVVSEEGGSPTTLDGAGSSSLSSSPSSPRSAYLQNVFEDLNGASSSDAAVADGGRSVVGYLAAILQWDYYFEDVLAEGTADGIYCVLENTCDQVYTWILNGPNATYVAPEDLHQPQYDELVVTVPLNPYADLERAGAAGACIYTLRIYPSFTLRDSFRTNKPEIYTAAVAVIFFFMAFTFFAYDKFVQRRNDKVIGAAARSNEIVSSLFPDNVRERLFDQARADSNNKKHKNKNQNIMGDKWGRQNSSAKDKWLAPKSGLKSFLNEGTVFGGGDDDLLYATKPIADLFPKTTVMFADIVGFTAWSSVREPSQVFTLLETFYRAFDVIAKRRRIFKVETVGDCYVAVAGLPEPRRDHCIAVTKFAADCLKKVNELAKKLEVVLGPDTGDLTIRVGIHSGPVTAGVLRGERSRFQLFGDTMNTAARMESTGVSSKIQLSQESADLLVSSGKSHWLEPRKERVMAKGKGEMQTYWLVGTTREGESVAESSHNMSDDSSHRPPGGFGGGGGGGADDDMSAANAPNVRRLLSDKTSRLIDWNTDVLIRLLKQMVARREAKEKRERKEGGLGIGGGGGSLNGSGSSAGHRGGGGSGKPKPLVRKPGATILDEVKEIIALPKFDARAARKQRDPEDVQLDNAVVEQLHDYITSVAIMYHDNAFHNFEHASHVAMSVTKLLSRIVAPSELLEDFESEEQESKRHAKKLMSSLHDHTYGITSDPLTQFAVVFSALIHDVDHMGVPNATLIKENVKIANLYNGKSVAEQNSIDLSWELLMDPSYADLRATIYATEAEHRRFRQLVVNTVMATDIVDKELKQLRNARWDRAFHDGHEESARDATNRKATIVIEHLIQASDVAHTMQHWHIYRKWNERFFRENWKAYKQGRADKDPSEFWYKGEIGFFDFYIIPLAKKLKECGVFGVSSDEYLNYATKNRQEWEIRGKEVVEEMLRAVLAEEEQQQNGQPVR